MLQLELLLSKRKMAPQDGVCQLSGHAQKGAYLCIDSKRQLWTRQSLHGKCGRNALPCHSSSACVLYAADPQVYKIQVRHKMKKSFEE